MGSYLILHNGVGILPHLSLSPLLSFLSRIKSYTRWPANRHLGLDTARNKFQLCVIQAIAERLLQTFQGAVILGFPGCIW